MTAESLNFGPEWLRALSRGGSVTSPPQSPAMPKSKLADYRYGREEMLALYIKDNKVPDQLQDKEFGPVLQDQPLQPLALEPLTEEEQRNFSMSVNSSAVLRLMGKGGGAPPMGVARGRGTVRGGGGGRGRGRGEGGFYQRGPEEGEVGFGRSREINRSQSWDDRGERRFEKPLRREGVRVGFEEGAVVPRKDYSRSDSDNWRTLKEEQQEEEDAAAAAAAAAGAVGGGGAAVVVAAAASAGAAEPGGSWRTMGGRHDDGGPRSAGWRDHTGEGRRKKFDFDFDFGEGGRRRNMDNDGLPEWCTDEEDGEMGTFDSSGAFMCIKKNLRDPIPEDQEFEFEALEEENGLERRESGGEGEDGELVMLTVSEVEMMSMPGPSFSSPPALSAPPPPQSQPPSTNPEPAPSAAALPTNTTREPAEDNAPPGGIARLSTNSSQSVSSPPSSAAARADLPPAGGDNEEEERMKHLQQEAEKMVASLQDTSLEEERFTQALQESHGVGMGVAVGAGAGAGASTHAHPHTHQTGASAHSHSHPHPATSHSLREYPASALPLSHEAAMKWFYKDPQAEIQGPFSTVEMCEWFQAGYFTMTLLVKRGCDEGFQPLGDVIKMWGRVPFSPGPSPPPLLSNMDQEVFKKQLEQVASAALYQQQLQRRYQHMNSSSGGSGSGSSSSGGSRCGESGMMPAMNRSMSVPDSGPMWDMHTSASQQSGGEASLWDLTIGNLPQGLSLEQLQQKLQQERRESELRAKREEEDRKRREEKRRQQQEEQKRREEEEEIFHRKQQCRQQQELLMKLLQQSQQQQPVGSVGAQSQGPCWNSAQPKPPKTSLNLLEMETERLLKQQQRAQQQQQQQQRERQQQQHAGLTMGQWSDGGVGGMWGAGGLEGKVTASGGGGGGGGSSGGMGLWDEAVKNQSSHRSMGLKNSRSSPSLSEQYMMRRKQTEDEEKLLRLLQGIKPQQQDGFTTWSEQMLHALNTNANNSSSSQEVATIVAYLKEVESPYEVHDFIRAYLGDTAEAKEFAKQFLERRAKQKANQQRQQQQQQLSKELSGLNMNFPLQSMFQASHSGKSSVYDTQGSKMKKKPNMMLHSDPSILGYSFLGAGERMILGEMETVEDY